MASIRSHVLNDAIKAAIAEIIECSPDEVEHFAIAYTVRGDHIGVASSTGGVQPTLTLFERGIARVLEQGGLAGHYVR